MISQRFECLECGRALVTAFLPSRPPKCPSCGGSTSASEGAKLSDTGFCPSCHKQNRLYEGDRCECGALLSGFTGNQPEEYSRAVQNTPTIPKQGPSGGRAPKLPFNLSS